jgi:hypothetical protein
MSEQSVCLGLDPVGHVRISRAAVGRIVLESPVLGRVMRGGDDNAVGQTTPALAIVSQNGV